MVKIDIMLFSGISRLAVLLLPVVQSAPALAPAVLADYDAIIVGGVLVFFVPTSVRSIH